MVKELAEAILFNFLGELSTKDQTRHSGSDLNISQELWHGQPCMHTKLDFSTYTGEIQSDKNKALGA